MLPEFISYLELRYLPEVRNSTTEITKNFLKNSCLISCSVHYACWWPCTIQWKDIIGCGHSDDHVLSLVYTMEPDITWLIFSKPHRARYWVSLRIQTLIYILFQPLQWYTQYNAILDCVITAPDTCTKIAIWGWQTPQLPRTERP